MKEKKKKPSQPTKVHSLPKLKILQWYFSDNFW